MDKREEILAAALRLFVESGFHGTPTSKIAREAGVANGTLFHYFPTKDDLIVALYLHIKHRLSCHVAAAASEGGTLKVRLREQFLNALYWALDHSEEFRFLQQFQSSPYPALVPHEQIEMHARTHTRLLEEAIAEGNIKALPVDYILMLINSIVNGLHGYLRSREFPKAKQHEFINETFELLWDMLR